MADTCGTMDGMLALQSATTCETVFVLVKAEFEGLPRLPQSK